MRCTRDKVVYMPHVQIRNMPAALHRTMKARAAGAGLSLSEYLLDEIERAAEVPTLEELRDRVALLTAENPPESSAAAIRAERARA